LERFDWGALAEVLEAYNVKESLEKEFFRDQFSSL
jgi:hypothetical protein